MFFLKFITVSLIAGLLIGVVMAATPWLSRRYSPRWRYHVWLILALWLILPVTLPGSWALFTFSVPDSAVSRSADGASGGRTASEPAFRNQGTDDVTPVPETIQTEGLTVVGTGVPLSAETDETAGINGILSGIGIPSGMSLLDVLIMLWLLGTVFFLCMRGIAILRFRSWLHQAWRPCDSVDITRFVRQAMEETGFEKNMPIRVCRAVQSPFVTGMINPVLVLPEQEYNPRLLGHIIRHELTHCRRRDLWYKLATDLANAVHWFNPLVWIMNRASSHDLELVCDELVIHGQDLARRKEYGESILSTVKPGTTSRLPVLTTAFSHDANLRRGNLKELQKRFENIMATTVKHGGRVFPIGILVLVVLLGGAVRIDIDQTGTMNPGDSVANAQNLLPLYEFFGLSNYSDPCADLENWDLFPADYHNWRSEEGKLVHDSGTAKSKYAHLKDTVVSDGIIFTKLTLNGNPDTDDLCSALILRQKTTGNQWQSGYVVFVGWTKKGMMLNVNKGIPAGGDGFANRPDLKGHIIPGVGLGDEVTISVVMKGDRVDIYGNSVWVVGFNDDTFASGCVGLLLMDAKVSFYDFRIYNKYLSQ